MAAMFELEQLVKITQENEPWIIVGKISDVHKGCYCGSGCDDSETRYTIDLGSEHTFEFTNYDMLYHGLTVVPYEVA